MNIEDHKRLVYHIINKRKRHIKTILQLKKYMTMKDIEQLGMIGLWKAIRDFDESKGYEFSTYAYRKIEGEILNPLRMRSDDKKKFYHDTEYITSFQKDDNGEYIETPIIQKEDKTAFMVKDFISTLTEEERNLIYYKMNKFTQKEMKELTGLHAPSIALRLKRIGKIYNEYRGNLA